MVARRVIVRKLDSLEVFEAVSDVQSDKTGSPYPALHCLP